MSIIVKKYGGTSVSTVAKIKNIAKNIILEHKKGKKIVVVLSAMGTSTDELVSLSKKATKTPNPRDYDLLLSTGEQVSISLLSMILNDLGASAISFTGWQAGIETDCTHTKARISRVSTKRIKSALKKRQIVVVAGFQGINKDLDYVKVKSSSGDIYYFAEYNFEFQRLEKQFKEKSQWIDGIPKLKTISQLFKERGGFEKLGTLKGSEMVGWKYEGPFDELEAQSKIGGYPFADKALTVDGKTGISCHRIIDGGKDSIGNDVVVVGEGTGIVHTAPGCGAIDKKIAEKAGLISI